MKQIFTTLLALIISVSAIAQNSGRLSITSFNSNSLVVIIDNRSYQLNNNRDILLNDVPAGNHQIKIVKQIRGSWRRNTIIYESNLFIRRGMHVDMLINRFGRVFIDEELISEQYNDNNQYDNWNNQNNNPLSQAMSPTSFEQLKQIVSNERYENTRLTIAKQAISVNMFSAQQAKELISVFTYENNKLDIAKTMYPRTIDKNNYVIVYDVFSYSSSKEDLARFIQQFR